MPVLTRHAFTRNNRYSAADVAALMGTSEPMIRRAMERGLIPSSVATGTGERRVGHAELVAWLDAQPGMEPLAREVEGAG
jgi:predicted DNA-binding transcriptional regulator AlpA